MVAGMEECSYSELGVGPLGLLITAKEFKVINMHKTSGKLGTPQSALMALLGRGKSDTQQTVRGVGKSLVPPKLVHYVRSKLCTQHFVRLNTQNKVIICIR